MLLELRVQNFRSVSEEQVFSMLPGKGATHTHHLPTNFAPQVLKAAALYGPNGSGKSTLVQALGWLQALVRDSGTYNSDDVIPHDPHLLDHHTTSAPTVMEVQFVANQTIWRYRVGADSSRITEESLHARSFQTSRERRIFVRNSGEIGPDLSGYADILLTKTNKNQLFLSKLDQFSADAVEPAYYWLVVTLRVINSVSNFPKYVTAEWCKDDNKRDAVVAFLRSVDTRVEKISVKTNVVKTGPEALANMFRTTHEPIFDFDKEGITQYSLEFFHKNTSNELTAIGIHEESLGTRNLFALAGPLLQSLTYGFVIVIDELNQSFHTELLRYILDLFYSTEANQSEAQIIFTSHDVSVMDVLERDEIWLVEKNHNGATELAALSDFGSTREGGSRRRAAFGKQYLENRFGALPYTDRVLLIHALDNLREANERNRTQ